MPSRLYRGGEIARACRNGRLLGRQNPCMALEAIRRKYGRLEYNRYYYHRGNGEWVMYNTRRDAKHQHGDAKVGRGKFRHTHDWKHPRKVRSEYGTLTESEIELIRSNRGMQAWRERRHSDYFDPHELDHSLGRWERERDWQEKWKDYLLP